MEEIEAILKKIDEEVDAMCSSFLILCTIIDKGGNKLIYDDPYFWFPVLNSLLTNFIVTFGRVFEKPKMFHFVDRQSSKKDNLSIYYLFKYLKKNIELFEKNSLLKRKPKYPIELLNRELQVSDVVHLENELKKHNNIIGKIRSKRNRFFAHCSVEDLFTEDETTRVKFQQAWKVVSIVRHIKNVIFQAYHNGNLEDVQTLNCLSEYQDEYHAATLSLLDKIED